MTKMHTLLLVLAMGMLITAMACASAANSTEAVGEDTGSTVGSVGNGVVSVVEWPFHVIADIL